MTIQVAPDDCTGCGVCVDVCPAVSKEVARHKAINMETKSEEHLGRERPNFQFFTKIPEIDRKQVKADTVKGSQLLEPLFEFSGACAGCGETPYLKLLTQLLRRSLDRRQCDRLLVDLWGQPPDHALGEESGGPRARLVQLAVRGQRRVRPGDAPGRQPAGGTCARTLLGELAPQLGEDLAASILDAHQETEEEIHEQRRRVAELKERLSTLAGCRGEGPPGGGRYARAAERLDRRWRRLGV